MKQRRFAAPYIVWMVISIVAPMALVIYYAFTNKAGGFSFDSFLKIFSPTEIQGEMVYMQLSVLGKSLLLALECTAVCILVGYPAALCMASRDMKRPAIILVLFVVPMWMNFLLRTYAWVVILEPTSLLNTEFAVMLGMVYNFLPFMVLPIYSVLQKIDRSVIEAAQDLGANSVKVFFRVTLPLSMPGIVTGITMVFMPAVSTFVISRLLGGGKTILFGDIIESQFLFTLNTNYGSALSIILMVLILISMAIMNRYTSKEEGGMLF